LYLNAGHDCVKLGKMLSWDCLFLQPFPQRNAVLSKSNLLPHNVEFRYQFLRDLKS
jgi:hypothetical protein